VLVDHLAAEYKSGLSLAERRALASRHSGQIWLAMKRNARDMAVGFVERVIRDAALASRYAEVCRDWREANDGAASVSQWLKLRGFETIRLTSDRAATPSGAADGLTLERRAGPSRWPTADAR
jgi:hypothetical protein